MSLNLVETETPEEILEWRDQIITSVLTKGLKPSKDIVGNFLGSGNAVPLLCIDGIVIDGVDEDPMFKAGFKVSKFDLERGLYRNEYSVLPVMAERPENGFCFREFYQDPNNLETIALRISSSFLVVCLTNSDSPSRMGPIRPKRFLCAIFPEEIWRDYQVRTPGLSTKVNIRTISGQVMRRFRCGFPCEIAVPDYESELNKLSIELKGMKFVHGVRLPIASDITRLPERIPLSD